MRADHVPDDCRGPRRRYEDPRSKRYLVGCPDCGATVIVAHITRNCEPVRIYVDPQPAAGDADYLICEGHPDIDAGSPSAIWADHPRQPTMDWYADENQGVGFFRRRHSCLERQCPEDEEVEDA